jgi:formylmethanofuran dehydrogenase subunit E
MTKKIGNIIIIDIEESKKCELCGELAECRPYGPNGEQICFECGMKDEETTKKKFYAFIDGD